METGHPLDRAAATGPARHHVTRLIADEAPTAPSHSHVVGVETSTGNGPRAWQLVEFVQAVRLGERFYLSSEGGSVEVEPRICPHCSRVTIAAIDA